MKKYKQEYLNKVKEKFNELQSNSNRDKNDTRKPSDNKGSQVYDSARVVVKR